MDMTPALTGKVALVTGATRGIGYEMALQLAKLGAHVIAVGRTQGALEELDDAIVASGGAASLVPLDLSDMEAIDRLGGIIHDRWGHLDILVANAAILGPITPISQVKAKDFEEVMNINLLSIWRLVRSVDPLMRQAEAARAIIMSSAAAHSTKAYWGPYSISKAAVEALARTWANETRQTKMCINSVNPGATRTSMRAQAMPGEDPQTLPSAQEIASRIVPLAGPAITQSGMIYDAPTQKWVEYRRPA